MILVTHYVILKVMLCALYELNGEKQSFFLISKTPTKMTFKMT